MQYINARYNITGKDTLITDPQQIAVEGELINILLLQPWFPAWCMIIYILKAPTLPKTMIALKVYSRYLKIAIPG